ncbi:MAG: heavy metal-binding domain-containing protein [Erysipelotrichaceae bacterium]
MGGNVCDHCGGKAQKFNSYATVFNNQTKLCEKCYHGIEGLQKYREYESIEELKETKNKVLTFLEESKYQPLIISDIEAHFIGKYESLLKLKKIEPDEDFEKEVQMVSKESLLVDHKMTTGYNFEGYRIVSYLGVVTGETVLGTGFLSSIGSDFADMFGTKSKMYADKLKLARTYAQENAIMESIRVGGNAMIGVDIDYINFTGDKMGVVYTGTSVLIERISENLIEGE